jgi:pilus assembly protein FimV
MGRKFAAVVFSLGCLQANSAWALGLGELQLESFLNEPLEASVDLLNTDGLHEDEIKVRLGTREDFKRLGLDRPFFLTSIEFDVAVGSDGNARIVMSTSDPVLEPYLDFIIEARWPSGRLLREYTVLVDPPAFSTATPIISASKRVEEVEGIPAPTKKTEAVTSTGTKVDVRKSGLGPGEMPQRDFNAATATSPVSGSKYMIKRDDTLWQIAASAAPEGATVHQTMLDIQRLNPNAFINNNINRVKAGYIVYLPSADDISSGDLSAALQEVNEQNAAWREGRDAELAASRGPSLRISADTEEPTAETGDETTGAASDHEAGSAGLADTASAGESGDVSGTSGSGEGLSAMQDRVDTLERIVDLKDEQIAALQAALADAGAETPDSDMEEADYAVIDPIEDDTNAEDEAELSDTGVSAEASVDAAVVSAPVEEAPAEEAAAKKSKPAAVKVKSSKAADKDSGGFMDYILYVVGAAVLALLAFFFMRRRGESSDDDYQEDEAFSNVQLQEERLDVEEEPELDLAAEMAAAAPVSNDRGYGERKHDAYASDVEAADALAEADIYIAYGRHGQAVDLLNNALVNEPNNPVYRLKLIEIHTELNDRDQASEQLHQLRNSGDADSIARGEELLASLEAATDDVAEVSAPEQAAPASDDASGPGLAPNPLSMMEDSTDSESDFSGLEIEEGAGEASTEEDLDLSGDFPDDEEELVIAADANGMSTKLDLARAYIDMGDDDGARQILDEVVAEGNEDAKAEAQSLLDRIG